MEMIRIKTLITVFEVMIERLKSMPSSQLDFNNISFLIKDSIDKNRGGFSQESFLMEVLDRFLFNICSTTKHGYDLKDTDKCLNRIAKLATDDVDRFRRLFDYILFGLEIELITKSPLHEAVRKCQEYFEDKGFWDDYPEYWENPCNDANYKNLFQGPHSKEATYVVGTKLALVHSEVTECLSEINYKEWSDDIPEKLKNEIVDIALRAFDLGAGLYGAHEFTEAILDKVNKAYSNGRPYMHGKRF